MTSASASDPLAWSSIAELAPRIARGDVSPVHLTELMLERIAGVGTSLNAFADVWHDDAMSTAQAAADEIDRGRYRGPMHGIPIALKDLVDVAGKRTAAGSMVLQSNVASDNATIAQRLSDAGAVVLGKTNLVEFAFGPAGVNAHTGPVRNPWRPERVTGGSSSGSGAAVAAACAYAAIGTDTGGSVRMPASICGIAGLKPTYGLVPRTGVMDLAWSLDHVGPMARRTIDCAHFLNAMHGADGIDQTATHPGGVDYTASIDDGLDGLRIGAPRDAFFNRDLVDPSVAASVSAALELLASHGAEVVTLADWDFAAAGRPINVVISLAEAAAVHRELIANNADDYTDAVRSRILTGFDISAVDYIQAQRARRRLNAQMAAATSDVDAVVTPTIPVLTPTIAECTPPPGSALAAKGAELPLFTSLFDVTGQPSLTVNCGFDPAGMPIGMMISGAAFADPTVLRIGHAYEELAGWHQARPEPTA